MCATLSAILKLSATLLWCYHNTEQGDSNFSVSDLILDTPTHQELLLSFTKSPSGFSFGCALFRWRRLFHKVKHFLLINKILFSSKFGHPWWQNQDFQLKRRKDASPTIVTPISYNCTRLHLEKVTVSGVAGRTRHFSALTVTSVRGNVVMAWIPVPRSSWAWCSCSAFHLQDTADFLRWHSCEHKTWTRLLIASRHSEKIRKPMHFHKRRKVKTILFKTRYFAKPCRKDGLSRRKRVKITDLGWAGPVVQKVDNAIHWINLYPLDNITGFPNIYPLDSDLSSGLHYPKFERQGQMITWFKLAIIMKSESSSRVVPHFPWG